jgi:8-oxo-dGTP pyrophosphatase MutT (NUDIX family)
MGYDSLEMTVKREIFVEVGIEIKDFPRYIYRSSFITGQGIRVLDTFFLCEYEAGIAFPKSPEEVGEFIGCCVFNWISFSKIAS